MSKDKRHPDRAYLLRCWQEGRALRGDESRWRYSLEGVWPTRSHRGFDDLEALVAFLLGELIDGATGESS